MSMAGYTYPISEYLELLLFEMDTAKSQYATARDPIHCCVRKKAPNQIKREKENGLMALVLTQYLED